MKQYMKNTVVMAALLLTTLGTWAANEVTINTNGKGKATSEVSNGVCTLTLVPDESEYATVDNITAVKTVSGGSAQAPRRSPEVDNTAIVVKATDASADPSGQTTYTLTMPGDDYDVEVTVDFQSRVGISDAVITFSPASFTYDGEAKEPVLTVTVGGKALAANEFSVSFADNTEAGNATATVTGLRTYTGTASASFAISQAAASVSKAPAAVANLVYTGEAQALITAGEAVGGELQYKLGDNGTYGTTVPTATAAGTYKVFYKVVADANHTDVAEASIDAAIGQAAASVSKAPAAVANLVYTGEAQALITAGEAVGGELQYKLGDNGTYGTTVPTAIAAGTYKVFYKVVADANHTDVAEASIDAAIGQAAASVSKAPAAVANLVYTGEAQALITAGEAVGGELQYKLGDNGTYGTTVPTATAAGTYKVFYKVVADANHTDVAEASIDAAISQAAASVSKAPAAVANLVYTGEAQALITAGEAVGGELQYKLGDNGTYGTTVPTATAAGTYKVFYKVVADANHTDVAEASIDAAISQAAASVSKAPAAVANLVYTGEAQALITAGEAVGGELQYKLGDNGTYGTTVPTATAAGTYKVFYKVVAAANYTDLAEASIEVSVAKANPDLEMVNEILTLDAFQTSTTYMNDVKVKLNGNAITGNFTFTYESSNESVATVNANGEVQALGVGEAVIVVRGPIDDANLNEAEVTYNVSVYTTYGITVYKDEKSITIDNTNRNDVFGDGTVKYDGRQTLILENAHFSGALDAYITTSNEELKIFLKGENSFDGVSQAIMNTKGNATLTFTTEGNTPGTVTMKNTSGSSSAQVILGFTNIVFEQNLTILSGGGGQNEMTVGTPIAPFVDDNTEKKAVDVAEAASQSTTSSLSNTSIQDVLYTLKEESDGTGDKVDATENCVVLASAMVENEVDEAVTTYQPGTDSFAEAFQGLTFMVPAGTGNVIVNVKTGPEGVLNVKIGRDEPYVIKNALDFTEYVFPYACSEATYVYIYNASEVKTSAPAHRAGRKTSITVGVRTVGVQAIETQISNAAGASAAQAASTTDSTTPASFEEIEVKEVAGAAVIDNANVVTLPNGFFTERAYSNTIDLRGTSISGMVVSRTDGVFKNVSKNTFIYMPTGNSTEESNVVFGKVCDNAVLDAQMPEGESFGPSDAFTAKRIELDRTFKKNEVATVYLPFDISLNIAISEFGTFYTFGRAANGFIKIEEVKTNLKANTPYIFKSREDNVRIATRVVRVSMPDESAAAPARRTATEDGLYGCYKHQDAGDGTLFKLVAGETLDDLKFERMTAGDKVLPFQAYLKLNGQEADSFSVTDDEAVVTGIRSIATEQSAASEEWQTLSGVRMQQKPASKGVYIHNGKKIVVK